MRVLITPRRRTFLGDVPSTIVGKAAAGIISTMGVAFPGFGFLIGFALSKLGVFADERTQVDDVMMAHIKEIGRLLKAKDYAGADQLASYHTFRWITMVSSDPGPEQLFFLAIFGNAVQSGNYAKAIEFARRVDAGQVVFDAWLDSEYDAIDAERARITPMLDPNSGYATGNVETVMRYDGNDERYKLMYEDSEGRMREVRTVDG